MIRNVAFRGLLIAIPLMPNRAFDGDLGEGLQKLAPGQDAVSLREAASALSEAWSRERGFHKRMLISQYLASVAGAMSSPDARKACSEMARALAVELEQVLDRAGAAGGGAVVSDPSDRRQISDALASIAARIDPPEAAAMLLTALGRETDDPARKSLAKALLSVTDRFHPARDADFRVRVARALTTIPVKPVNKPRPKLLASELATFAEGMDPAEAKRLCMTTLGAILTLYDPGELDIDDLYAVMLNIQSHDLFRELVSFALSSDWNEDVSENIIRTLLNDTGRSRWTSEQATVRDEAKGAGPKPRPLPCRLTTSELVELLKMPTCRRGTRRIVLDHLGNIHGRRFANHWEFVRFAREQRLAVDLTTPPRRPDPADSVRRMLAILDSEEIP